MSSTQKIKLAHIITRLDWGGSPDIVRILCSRLDPAVYDITLYSGPGHNLSARTNAFLSAFRGRIVIIPELKRDVNPVSDIAAFLRLAWLLGRQRPDIVHTHTAKAGAIGRMAAFISTRAKIVHTAHGHNFYGYFNNLISGLIILIERVLAKITQVFIALTELEKADMLRYRVGTKENVRVIYQGLELDVITRAAVDRNRLRGSLRISDADMVVGMVARLEPVKGCRFFVEAARQVLAQVPNCKFLLVGDGSLRPELERLVDGVGLKDKFIFTGWREDAAALMTVCDILVLPSLNEAVGMVLIEAQAQGIPVVATEVGGIPEVVTDGQTGSLVPPADSGALAKTIVSLLSNDQRRIYIGKQSREWVRGKFDAPVMVAKIEALYQELLQRVV